MGYTTLNGVQLQIPTRATKNWDAVMLNTTWANIAAHDHTGNPKGNQLAAGSIANNAITNAKFRQSVGTSVVGRSAGTTGDVADIVAGSDNQVLRRASGALSWGSLTPSFLAALTADRALITDGTGIIGVSAVTSTELGYLSGANRLIQSQITQNRRMVGPSNIGITYVGGTGVFSVASADGTALSASNVGYVNMQSTTGGQLITLAVTANSSFIDDIGASDIVGEEFGTKAGTAWTPQRPFYLYAINTNNTGAGLYFAISPVPNFFQTPSTTGLLGYKGNPSSTPSDSSMWILGSGLTLSNFTSKPVLRIGAITMAKSSADDWTVSLTTGSGISPNPLEGNTYTWNAGEAKGSVASSYFNNAGAPTWATPANIVAKYKQNLNGMITTHFTTANAGNCTNGGNASQTRIVLPFEINFNFYSISYNPGLGGAIRTGNVVGTLLLDSSSTFTQDLFLYKNDFSTAVANNSFSNSADDIFITTNYLGFLI